MNMVLLKYFMNFYSFSLGVNNIRVMYVNARDVAIRNFLLFSLDMELYKGYLLL